MLSSENRSVVVSRQCSFHPSKLHFNGNSENGFEGNSIELQCLAGLATFVDSSHEKTERTCSSLAWDGHPSPNPPDALCS